MLHKHLRTTMADDDVIYMGTTYIDETDDLWMASNDTFCSPSPLPDRIPTPPIPDRVPTPPSTDDDDLYMCAITGEYMHDPVHAADGFPYEHTAIVEWFNFGENARATEVKSPRTNKPMAKFIFRSFDYYKSYKTWCERTSHPMPITTTTFGLLQAPEPAPAARAGRSAREVVVRGAPAAAPTAGVVRLNCTDVSMNFTLKTFDNLHFGGRDQTLRQRMDRLVNGELVNLIRANTGRLPPTRTKRWYIDFIVWAVKAHERHSLWSLDGYGLYYLSVSGFAGEEHLLVSSTADIALKLFTQNGKPLNHIFSKLTINELEDFVLWNSTDAGVFNTFQNHRTKASKIDALCNLMYATCLAP